MGAPLIDAERNVGDNVLLAGRVAEAIAFGDISTGAHNDLQRATDIARSLVTQYGMSQELGLVAFEQPRVSPYLDTPLVASARTYSEQTAQTIDGEVRKGLAEAEERVHHTLETKRVALDALAHRLLEQEIVDRTALLEILTTHDGASEATKRDTDVPSDAPRALTVQA